MDGTPWIRVAAALGGLGVAAGAFGAHGLAGKVPPRQLEVFEVAVRYQLLHAAALLALAALASARPAPGLDRVGKAWTAGVGVFSGSLYAYALTGIRRFGMITPIGGVLMIAGWALLFRAASVPAD